MYINLNIFTSIEDMIYEGLLSWINTWEVGTCYKYP